jgi:hypothetical protein
MYVFFQPWLIDNLKSESVLNGIFYEVAVELRFLRWIAEFPVRVPSLFNNGSPGQGKKEGVLENRPHLSCQQSILSSVSLINESDEILSSHDRLFMF